jgi:hypothetical protein
LSRAVELVDNFPLLRCHGLLIDGLKAIIHDDPKIHANITKMRAHRRFPKGKVIFINLGGIPEGFICVMGSCWIG